MLPSVSNSMDAVWRHARSASIDQLKAAAQGRDPSIPLEVATLALKQRMTEVAKQGMQAQQQLSTQGTARERLLAQLPEDMGIGRLPAPNMAELGYAEGGIVGYADGGEVERYADTGLVAPEGYEMYEDPTTGEVYPRKIGAGVGPAIGRGVAALGNWLDRATTPGYKKTPEWYAQNQPAPAAPAQAPEAPAAPTGGAQPPITLGSKKMDKAAINVLQPKVPVENPTEAEKSNLDKTLASTEKLYDFLDKKFGDQLAPIKAQLEKDREAYSTMKSENVGLALLSAAGAMLKPGQSTASAIGSALTTAGEYGMRIQPQLLAARQGISAGEVGLAQAQAQAARGNFGTAAQLVGQDQARALQERELAIKEPLYKAQAGYYGAAAGAKAAGGGGQELAALRATQSNLQAQLKGLQGKVDPQSQAMARQIQMQLQQIGQVLAQKSGIALNTGFIQKPSNASGATIFRSSLLGEE